jgi:hypothetical protein
MSTLCPAHWDDDQAEFYARTIAQSGYADAVVPLLGGPFADVLDIGAGSGELTARVLTDGARWSAVEPQPAMQRRLLAQKPSLTLRGIELVLHPQTWQALPSDMVAHTVLAANVGATHHEAARFFDAMRPRAQKNMLWVVAAQHGPSTFCAAGFLPPDLHGADTQPAIDHCLTDLGSQRQPHALLFAEWDYRVVFPDVGQAQAFFLQRLALQQDSGKGQAVCEFVARHVQPHTDGVTACCRKRSAILRWEFESV